MCSLFRHNYHSAADANLGSILPRAGVTTACPFSLSPRFHGASARRSPGLSPHQPIPLRGLAEPHIAPIPLLPQNIARLTRAARQPRRPLRTSQHITSISTSHTIRTRNDIGPPDAAQMSP
ncbi:hypothetical protein DPSP01_012866 [Paraphaeosphaeria sporulosa]